MAYVIVESQNYAKPRHAVLSEIFIQQRSYPEYPHVKVLTQFKVLESKPHDVDDVKGGLLFMNKSDALSVILALSACGSEALFYDVLFVEG